LELFLGVKPSGLWALSYREEWQKILERLAGGGSGSGLFITVADVIAVALSASDGGKRWKAGGTTTSVVKEVLQQQTIQFKPRDADWDIANALYASIMEIPPVASWYDGPVDEVVAAMAATVGDDTFSQNMRALADKSILVPKELWGVCAAGVTVWTRSCNQDAGAGGQAGGVGFIGNPGDKKVTVWATVRSARWICSSRYPGGGDMYLHKLIADDGKVIVWMHSSTPNLPLRGGADRGLYKDGDRVQVQFTVKAHKHYVKTDMDGNVRFEEDETVVIRLRVLSNPTYIDDVHSFVERADSLLAKINAAATREELDGLEAEARHLGEYGGNRDRFGWFSVSDDGIITSGGEGPVQNKIAELAMALAARSNALIPRDAS
jgi:hypothetical protein